MTVCHVWPGMTPAQIWELPFIEWLIFAQGADDYAAKATR